MAYRRINDGTESAVDYAVALIRQRIRTGDLVPGQRLVAGELSKELNISGSTIREALTTLAGESLIEVQPYRGAIVRTQSKQDIAEIFDLREVIEGLAARLAAQAVSQNKASPEALELAARKCRELAEASSFLGYADANTEFHDEVYALANSSRITKLAKQLSDQIDRLNNRRLGQASVLLTSASEHDEIVAAIALGNEALAEERMRQHVRESKLKALGTA